jgi:YkoY family integral membrane protein
MFGQTFELHDLITIGVLVVLEGVLSIDNALVLGLLARRLPKHLQARALTYGLVGAFAFRGIAVATAAYLLHWHIVKLAGGLYLIWVAIKHFFGGSDEAREHERVSVDADGQPVLVDDQTGRPVAAPEQHGAPSNWLDFKHTSSTHTVAFWMTVAVIELTDIAFAVDSIVAAIGVVGPPPESGDRHPKLWVVFTGGMLGVVLMRYAARVFILLLEKFPRFETSAYLLVIVIGAKLNLDYLMNRPSKEPRLDFHDVSNPAFWIFWAAMIACFLIGFIPHKSAPVPSSAVPAKEREQAQC